MQTKNGKTYVKPFKYGNKPMVVNGIRFASKKEMNRYKDLELLERVGTISDLKFQVPYTLIPKQTDDDGKVMEYPITYVADFTYKKDGQLIVEDCKGFRTPEYVMKRKLMLYFYGIRIRET